MKKRTNKPKVVDTPEPIEKIGTISNQFDPSPLLARIDKLENSQNIINNAVDFVKSTNWFILSVLFLGFITLLISFITLIIQAYNANSTTQIELVKSIEQLKARSDIENKYKIDQSTISGKLQIIP